MSPPVSLRLTEEDERNLRRLEATGRTRSDAIRFALAFAATSLQRPETLAAEVRSLAADESDGRVKAETTEFMGDVWDDLPE